MKFVMYVEGATEQLGLPNFFRRYLNSHFVGTQQRRIGIDIVPFEGWSNFEKKARGFVESQMSRSNAAEIIAIIGLLDLHGPTFTSDQSLTVSQRVAAGQKLMNGEVAQPKFRQHFAVHDVEAWLLSQPEIFPEPMRDEIRKKSQPENVNGRQPPSAFLNSLYQKHFGKQYKKSIQGPALFAKLDPNIAYAKCPHLQMMLDDMLKLAQSHRQ